MKHYALSNGPPSGPDSFLAYIRPCMARVRHFHAANLLKWRKA